MLSSLGRRNVCVGHKERFYSLNPTHINVRPPPPVHSLTSLKQEGSPHRKTPFRPQYPLYPPFNRYFIWLRGQNVFSHGRGSFSPFPFFFNSSSSTPLLLHPYIYTFIFSLLLQLSSAFEPRCTTPECVFALAMRLDQICVMYWLGRKGKGGRRGEEWMGGGRGEREFFFLFLPPPLFL